MTEKRYFVVARNGHLSVRVNEGIELDSRDVVLFQSNDVDETFDWKDDMDARVARLSEVANA